MSLLKIFSDLIPIYLMFMLGYSLKRLKIADEKDAKSLFIFIFNAFTPAMFIYSIPKIELSFSLLKLPLFTVVFMFMIYILGRISHPLLRIKMDKVQYIAALMIVNFGFCLPFYVSKYGYDKVAIYNMFELGGAVMIYFLVQYFYANDKISLRSIEIHGALKILKSPPIMGLIFGLIINFTGIQYPKPISEFLYKLVFFNANLIMLGLGIYFSPKWDLMKESLAVIAVKMLLGIIVALVINVFFQLNGPARTILFLVATAPLGTNNITFAVMYKKEKDVEFASAMVSLSLLIGLVVSGVVTAIF